MYHTPNTDPLLDQEPHSCGMIALHELFPDIPTPKLKEAYLFCCQKWPHDGANKRDMNIVLKFLKLDHLLHYHDVSADNISLRTLIEDVESVYMVLVPGHYFVIKHGVVIDYGGDSYYQQQDHMFVHCYWKVGGREVRF